MRRKSKRMHSLIAVGMASLMLFGCGNANSAKTKQDMSQAGAGQYPDYLNLESVRPIVKDGEEITLTMLVMRETIATSDVNENWFAKFIEEKLNINLEIEEVNATTFEERKNLKLASNDLPDIMINMNLSANDIVTYGVDGGQLLPMSDYMNEELTPNIVEMLKDQEVAAIENTAPDGKMYTLPTLYASYPGYGDTVGVQRMFIDTKYMEAAGITELPETLDEFVEMLRAFKRLDPAQMGTKEIWPMVSTWGADKEFLQNAFGWVVTNRNMLTNLVWDMETEDLVVPCAQEKYGEYVKVLNTLYSEGLIHPDFFTIDKTAARGLYAEGAVPVICDAAPYLSVPERFDEFVSAVPVSSPWCENGVTIAASSYDLGRTQISADTDYPEVCMRLLDYLYSPEGSVYSTLGCPAGSEDAMGLIEGFYLNENGLIEYADVVSGKYETQFDYMVNAIELSQHTPRDDRQSSLYAQKLLGVENPKYPEMDRTDPDDHYRAICYDAHQGHLEDGLPTMYMAADQAARYGDLQTVIQNHVDAETAKFVVGQRPISEMDKYFEELKALGIDEYIEMGKAAYKNYERPQK